jgi:mRNA-degrading endonuclease RelE of RelBE toxin-antitoxin system
LTPKTGDEPSVIVIYRLHLPGARILYEVDGDASSLYVINIALTA